MSQKKKIIVFPPEASTNWLIQESYLINILHKYDHAIIDINDYKRYQRLVKTSKMTFMKCFMIEVLIRKNFLLIIDYSNYYGLKDCINVFHDSNSLADRVSRFDPLADLKFEIAHQSYIHYIDYARNDSRRIEYQKLDPKNLSYFLDSQQEAKMQARQIKSKGYDDGLLRSYIQRLFTKTLSALNVVKSLNKIFKSHNFYVFDSSEYLAIEQLIRLLKVKKYEGLSDLSQISEISSFKEIPSSLYSLMEIKGLSEPTLTPFLLALIKLDKVELERVIEILENNSIDELKRRSKELYNTYNKVSLLRSRSFKSIFDSIWGAVSTVYSVISANRKLSEYKKCIIEFDDIIEAECPEYVDELSKFIASAIFANESSALSNVKNFEHSFTGWIVWLKRTFSKPSGIDLEWNLKQRKMGAWVEDKNLRWFENFNNLRFRTYQKNEFQAELRYLYNMIYFDHFNSGVLAMR